MGMACDKSFPFFGFHVYKKHKLNYENKVGRPKHKG